MANKKITEFGALSTVPNDLTGKLLVAGNPATGRLYCFPFNSLESWIKALLSDPKDTTLLSIEVYEGNGLVGVSSAAGSAMDGALRNYNSNLRFTTDSSGLALPAQSELAIARVIPNLPDAPEGKSFVAIPVVSFSRLSPVDTAFYKCRVIGRPMLTSDTAPHWEIVLINPTDSIITLGATEEESIDISYTCRYYPCTLQ